MPPGSMQWKSSHNSLPGYEKYGSISIKYHLPSGIIDGKRFEGASRNGFLPNNDEGKNVLKMLVKAFERKLTF